MTTIELDEQVEKLRWIAERQNCSLQELLSQIADRYDDESSDQI